MKKRFSMIFRGIPVKTVAAFWVVALLALSVSGPLRADDEGDVIRGDVAQGVDVQPHQVWLLSTRGVPCDTYAAGGCVPLQFWRLGPNRTWLASDQETFQASDEPGVPTGIFIHGNRETSQEALCSGMDTYRKLTACKGTCRLRFVIWSWPSAKGNLRGRNDIRQKAVRSDFESYLLAQCVDRIHPDVPVGLVGYSFGARIITGALHLLGGGQVASRTLAERSTSPRVAVQTVLVAAAMDNDWLLPGHRNCLAMGQLDAILITRNERDPVLRWYPRVYERRGPEAMGATGPICTGQLGNEAQKIKLLGVASTVGRNHAWQTYLDAVSMQAGVANYAFPQVPGAWDHSQTLEIVGTPAIVRFGD